METPEFPPDPNTEPGATPEDVSRLQSSVAGLRLLMVLMLAILVTGAMGVNFYLVRKVGDARRQSEELERRVVPLSTQFENTLKPRISAFLNALVNFSKTNPDFVPILQKYPIGAAASAQSSAPSAPQPPGAAPAALPAPKQ